MKEIKNVKRICGGFKKMEMVINTYVITDTR